MGGARSSPRHAPHPGRPDPAALAPVPIDLPDRVGDRAGAMPAPLHPPEGRMLRARFRPATGFGPADFLLRLAFPVAAPVPRHVHVVPVALVIRPGSRRAAEE